MSDLRAVQPLVDQETGLAVVSTTRANGTIQATVVNAGILAHPISAEQVVGFVTRGGTRKHHHLRARSFCTVTFRRGWRWATVEGDAELIGPDDPADDVDPDRLRLLLRDIFRAAGGTHDDWQEYDRVMAAERRLAVLVSPRRVYSSHGG
ncbi:MAG: TIGR03618 family F420-dependent PPOX class oxidoreductase [Actinobacteria bacterium]|nr:TIGR03618 family F420-dependent PPOX class oxidoreductase [Actinomycetota bacterium]